MLLPSAVAVVPAALLAAVLAVEPQAARLNTIVAAITKANNFFFILDLLFIKTKSDLYGAFSAPPAVRYTGEAYKKAAPPLAEPLYCIKQLNR